MQFNTCGNNIRTCLLWAILLMVGISSAREVQNISSDWQFVKSDVGLDAKDVSWEDVSIPHTWNAIDGQNGGGISSDPSVGYDRMPCWYSKSLNVDFDAKTQRVFIKFDAASQVADTYLNGEHLGQHKGAFTAFCYEITDILRPGKANLLQVRVDNSLNPDIPPLSGDFTVFGGIYRPVYIITTPKTCITPLDYASDGVYISPKEVSRDSATIEILTKLSSSDDANVQVVSTITDADGIEIGKALTNAGIAKGKEMPVTQAIVVAKPHLWNGRKDPYLYNVKVDIVADGDVIDSFTEHLGIRSFYTDPRIGFILNEASYPLRGVNKHQDRKDKGWAVSIEDLKEDHDLIYEIGATCLRLAHYPHSTDFIDFCDKSGIMVWSEIPLVNKITYSEAFGANAEQQLIEMIRQRYNHPSIFCWGLWNELMHEKSPNPVALIEHLDKLANAEDPYRPTVAAANYAVTRAKGLGDATDLLAWNTYPGWYGGGTAERLGPYANLYNRMNHYKGVGISEYGAGASIHHHEQGITEGPKKTRAPWHPEEWQATLHEESYRQIKKNDFLWGTFVWNMFDFASIFREEGDAAGMNDKGLVTYDRKNRKDAFYFYKANWNAEPMVHIASKRHTERKDATTDVKVYSNAKAVELIVNGISQGKVTPDNVNVFLWENITIKKGKNTIKATAIINDELIEDTCTWTLE